ncbi:MAG: MFS transporter, partial [Dehalococcoidia bacterium]
MASGQAALPPAARVLPSNLFYGWYITLACAGLMLVGVGVGYYGLPIFLKPLSEEHGWSTAEVSWAPAIYFCVSGLTGAIAGPYIDEHGPRGLMFFGMLANAICAALIGLVNELWQLYAVYFAFAVAFGMSAGVAVNAIITRWFIRKRALAMSISATGVSLGGVILAPVASSLIDLGGLKLATPVLGALVLVVAIPVILLVLVWDPQNMGLLPDGDEDPAREESSGRSLLPASQMRTWTRGTAAGTVAFWALLMAFVFVLIAQTGYIIHQVSFLEERLGSRSTASLTISLTAFGSIVARLVVGIFADGVDKRLLTFALFVTQALCVAVVAHVDSVPVTWIVTL